MGVKATRPKGQGRSEGTGAPALTQAYVRRIIAQEFKRHGLPADLITEEMISAKREIITARRLLRRLAKWPKAPGKEV